MAVTKEHLEATVKYLNKVYGYGAGPRDNGQKRVGKGFKIDYAYGNVKLVYVNYTKGTGQYDISGRVTKSQLMSELTTAARVFEMKKMKY